MDVQSFHLPEWAVLLGLGPLLIWINAQLSKKKIMKATYKITSDKRDDRRNIPGIFFFILEITILSARATVVSSVASSMKM